MDCPRCGAAGSGSFCAHCGASLRQAESCTRCGSALLPGARYCIQCGAPAAAGRRPGGALLVGAGLVVLLAIAGAFWLGGRDAAEHADVDRGSGATPVDGARAGGAPPPLTGTMRQQADRLFERIMQARARGAGEDVAFFLPMALAAYDAVPDLDADGRFHLGLLQLEADRADAAAATARRILAADSTHLLGLALAAEAALAAGDSAAAAVAFTRYASAFDIELARNLDEYEVHRPALDEYRERARGMAGR